MTVRHLSIVGLGLLAWAACAPEGGAGDDPGAETGDERFWAQSMHGVGTLSEVTGFGNNPGGIRAYKYVPDNMPANAPMVLALHPCSLNASDYRRVGWERLADQLKFYVLYPEQQTNNNALRCFNWAGEFGDPTNLRRGEGENQSFKQLIDKMKADHSIDNARVFIMGHSGGGAQTALMMATWPELFAAGGIIAGVPYDCTRNFNQVSTCLSPGIDKTPQQHGDLVRAAVPNFAGTYPRLTIWHGASDTTVVPMNQRELMEQWTNAHGIDQTGDATSMVDGATRTEYKDAQGRTRVETITIPSFGHGTPVKPAEMCGTAGSFTLNANICAVQRMAEFFGLDGGVTPGDTTPPTVNITAPANNAAVSGRVTVQVQAMDDVGVTGVELFVNGQSRGTDTAAPWSIEWDTAGLPNGSYRLRVVARDAAGNEGADDDTTVRIMGGAQDTRAPTVTLTAPAAGATVRGTVNLSADATDDVGVVRVEFYAGATKVGETTAPPWSASWDASGAAPGMVTLSARAFDAAMNEGRSADVTVTVEQAAMPDTTPPTVRITAPAGGATVSGLVTISVDATDDVRVGQVLMFARDAAGAETLLGTDFRAPYEFLWSTEVEMDGARTLTARAFDASGNLANSDPVQVTITRPAPSPSPTDEPNPDGPKQVRIGKSWACATTAAPGDVFAQLALAFVAARLVRRRSK